MTNIKYPTHDWKGRVVSCKNNLQTLLNETCSQSEYIINIGEHQVRKGSEQVETVLKYHCMQSGLPLTAANFFDVCRVPKASE